MPANCIVKGCRSIQKKGGPISFYRLPWKNVRLRNEWIRRAGYDPNNYEQVRHISRDHRVCSLHFWNNRKESPFDLPTFNLGKKHRIFFFFLSIFIYFIKMIPLLFMCMLKYFGVREGIVVTGSVRSHFAWKTIFLPRFDWSV